MLLLTEQYAAKKQCSPGKVTCGVRNETSGQSWPSNTVVTNPFTGQNRNFKVWQRYPAQTSGRLAAKDKDFVPSVSKASLHWDGSAWRLEFLTFLLDKGPSTAAMVVELSVCQQLPDCQLANLDRWTGEIALSRELGALEGPVLSDVSFEGSAIIRAGGVDTPIAAGHTKYGTDEMDFDPVCVDDC